MLIAGKSKATTYQMTEYIRKVNPSVPDSVINMIPLYLSEGEIEGIRGDVAFAQSCIETGNFTFKGSAVTLSQNNFCGHGATSNGMTGSVFASPHMGIRAQIQHLKAYANPDQLVNECVDSRFKYVKRGSAPHVEWLGSAENPNGTGWATGSGYGKKIINVLENILKIADSKTGSNGTNVKKEDDSMKFFICVGHAKYSDTVISSADGRKNGGVNEYEYNKELAPYVVKWLEKAGYEAVLCIAPEKKLSCLNDEINYFIGEEKKQEYDVSVQLHLNAFDGTATGCEAYAYSDKGLEVAKRICDRLGTTWKNRGAKINQGLYWTKRTFGTAVLIESFFCDSKADYEKAKKLGMSEHAKLIAEGLTGQSITETATAGKVESDAIKYRVQCGAFKNRTTAERMVEKLSAAGFSAIIKEE